MQHFFLRAVFPEKVELVERCGFVRFARRDVPHDVIWAPGQPFFKGPLADVPADRVEGWLLRNGVAGQIFVAKMWGAGPD